MDEATLIDGFRGCVLGMAVGDALGAPLEGLTRDAVQRYFGKARVMLPHPNHGTDPGTWTDDTGMALCVARSIADLGHFDVEDVVRRLVAWGLDDPPGIGPHTRTVIRLLADGVPWSRAAYEAHLALGGRSAGSGAVMRSIPVALLHFRRPAELVRDSFASARLTHHDDRAGWGAAALNLAIAWALTRQPLEAMLDVIAARVLNSEVRQAVLRVRDMSWGELRTSGFVIDALQVALWCLLHTSSFEEALERAVGLGGGADTQGGVTGALAGAYYGKDYIPRHWLAPLYQRDELDLLALLLYRAARNDTPGET